MHSMFSTMADCTLWHMLLQNDWPHMIEVGLNMQAGSWLRSGELNHMHERVFDTSDGPPWKRLLAELDSASCLTTYR